MTAREERSLERVIASVRAGNSLMDRLDMEQQRNLFDALGLIVRPSKNTSSIDFDLDGMPVSWVRPYDCMPNKKALLHCHGGAFWSGTLKYSKLVSSRIASCCGMDSLTFEYRLAPENPFPAAVLDAMKAYKYLLDYGYNPEDIIISGESAGGSLALVITQKILDEGIKAPAGLILISPWTNLNCEGDSYQTNKEEDPTLDQESLLSAAKWYAGDAPLTYPGISPIYGSFKGFPKTIIQAGAREILLSDSVALNEKMTEEGVETSFEVFDKMWHVFHMYPVSQAKEALDKIGEFAKNL